MNFIAANCTLNMINDNICQHECNVPEFDYDHGDCCKLFIQSLDGCENCICHETGAVSLGTFDFKIFMSFSNSFEFLKQTEACMVHEIGDNVCHDSCNSKVYNFDEMDCCAQDNSDFNQCWHCLCHLTDDMTYPLLEIGK